MCTRRAPFEQFVHVLMQAFHIALHAARELAQRDLALPLQLAYKGPTALGHAPEERPGALEVQHLALIRVRPGAPASLTQRGLRVRLQRDRQRPFDHAIRPW
jgi:hypothetical protein